MPGAPAEIGSTANSYQILARLAIGGMAEIFLARGLSAAKVERYCVLKRILRQRAGDVHFVRMFIDEARLAAQLNHPNVAQVFDIGTLGDSYFFTMEYVHGETVRSLLHRAKSLKRELPIGSILTILLGAAAGLHHAHDRRGLDGRPLGIVHRDVSPSNLMVSFEGGVKVVDFGVAKAADRVQETRSGTVKGKISYLSPEQCTGSPVDRRTDLFALGIVTWELLTGERLYRRASDFDNMTAIVNEPTPAPSTRRPGVPPQLDAIALRLLEKEPAARYQTADELVDALEAAAVATGAMISTSGLGRLLRDLFGQRNEPWLDLTEDAPASEFGIPTLASVDVEEIPDLSDPGEPAAAGSSSDGVPIVGAQRATAPMRVTRGTSTVAPSPARAIPETAEIPAVPETALIPPPSPRSPIGRASAQHAAVARESAQRAAASSPRVSRSLPLPAPPMTLPEVLPNRLDPGSETSAPSLSELQLQQQPAPEPARRWPMVAVIAAAALIGSMTVWIAMPTDDAPAAPAAAAAPARSTASIAPPPVRAAAAAVPPAPIVVEPPPPSAAEAPSVAPEPVEPVEPEAVEPPPAKQRPKEPPPLELAMRAGRHADAMKICEKGISAATAAACTLAACQLSLDERARASLKRVPAASQPGVVAACRKLGRELDCEANPLRCQH